MKMRKLLVFLAFFVIFAAFLSPATIYAQAPDLEADIPIATDEAEEAPKWIIA